jgi:two-component system, OmpR family, phosphate regulon sensor histidine kinase PhoR
MSRLTIRIIIVLASLIFIGLVSTQIVWIKKAYAIADQQIEHEIELALTDVVKDIQRHSGDSAFLVDPVKLVSKNFYRVQINEELQPFYLENMLKREFLNRELNFDFEYSIYNCFNDSVVFSKLIGNDEDLNAKANNSPDIGWEDDGHYFSVFFPTLDFEILNEMKFWVASSIVLLCVLVFFAYVINVIMLQKRLSEIKNDFINNMTHELRTPISTIALSSDVLLQPGVEKNVERFRNYAQIIKSENDRLRNQVERVLQIARLDKQELELNKEPVDVHELINLAVPTIEMNFADQEIQIKTNLLAKPALILADEMHVTNIIYNLLDNAAKYSGPKTEIIIETFSNKNSVSIKVTDNGPGIPKDQQKLIFEKFYRISTGDLHDVKGFGIGLHYVKTISEAHGGKVKVQSELGKGSTFEVTLPYGTNIDSRTS